MDPLDMKYHSGSVWGSRLIENMVASMALWIIFHELLMTSFKHEAGGRVTFPGNGECTEHPPLGGPGGPAGERVWVVDGFNLQSLSNSPLGVPMGSSKAAVSDLLPGNFRKAIVLFYL